MKNKKRINTYDRLIEQFIEEFTKIPNFDLITNDETGSKLIYIVTFRIADIAAYRDLVCYHFIPATNKAIFEGQRDWQSSKYRAILKLQLQNADFKETLYDTIRLSYVALFHKLENYVNDVTKIPESLFPKLFNSDDTVVQWAKDRFKFDIKNWTLFPTIHKINWICNCVKHRDSYPTKNPKPAEFMFIDETQKITLTPEEFRNDCNKLITFYPTYLQLIYMFAIHKLATQMLSTIKLNEDQVEKINKIEEIIIKNVALIKGEKTCTSASTK